MRNKEKESISDALWNKLHQ